MIVTIWWEDSRQKVRPRIYGPNQLLAACVADDLKLSLKEAAACFDGRPLNGAGNVRARLRDDAARFGIAPLCAVFDRDKMLDLWPLEKRPSGCKSSICAAVRAEAPGQYTLVLLQQNMESVVEAACAALSRPSASKNPVERDSVLQRLAFSGTPEQRLRVRQAVDGFERLVGWSVKAIQTATAGRQILGS